MLNRPQSVVVILTIHVDKQQKMKQGTTFLASGRLILYGQGILDFEENESQHAERLEDGQIHVVSKVGA